ncbi:tetratricopeptide repeat 1 ttc1 [Trichoderma arundinaceum]|uniref:Tetratricopeptide repeat 1 ttc1 n=1 Tax=Trichoderma arundinaceum TaxID=490622 RepID=A0A395NL93_TRIAR|nr:tetratricopeptide repeat 1 ttc1 [Trichoderma arundinaceum]
MSGKEASQKEKPADEPEVVKFSPEEEAALLKESHAIKADANSLFTSQDYHNALSRYDDAIASCPNYLHYERAVLQSNIAACHLKVEQWKEAIKAATDAIDGLAKLESEEQLLPGSNDPKDGTKDGKSKSQDNKTNGDDDDDVEEEIVSSGAARSAPPPAPEPTPEQIALENRKADILRIRTKALLRRARARSEAGGWSNLAGAEEDYRTLSQMPGLTPADQRTVQSQLKTLPPRTKAAQEAEMSEMWGKLRNLGDGILKPFGLSTDNFKMVKDEKTGGYSMNFSQGGSSS